MLNMYMCMRMLPRARIHAASILPSNRSSAQGLQEQYRLYMETDAQTHFEVSLELTIERALQRYAVVPDMAFMQAIAGTPIKCSCQEDVQAVQQQATQGRV
jgi:hypothetical protein